MTFLVQGGRRTAVRRSGNEGLRGAVHRGPVLRGHRAEFNVPAGVFMPKPKVDSVVISLTKKRWKVRSIRRSQEAVPQARQGRLCEPQEDAYQFAVPEFGLSEGNAAAGAGRGGDLAGDPGGADRGGLRKTDGRGYQSRAGRPAAVS